MRNSTTSSATERAPGTDMWLPFLSAPWAGLFRTLLSLAFVGPARDLGATPVVPPQAGAALYGSSCARSHRLRLTACFHSALSPVTVHRQADRFHPELARAATYVGCVRGMRGT